VQSPDAQICANEQIPFRQLQRQAASDPLLVLACSAVLPKPAQREFLRTLALRQIPFHRALASGNLQLIRDTARRDPSVAIREIRSLLPDHAAVLEEVVRLIPGEAVAMAANPSSPTAQRLLDFLGDSPLGTLARNRDLDAVTRQRLAWVDQTLTAEQVADDAVYFRKLVELGQKHGLSRFAAEFLRASERPPAWPAKDLYLLVVYGRDHLDREAFQAFADKIGKPAADWPQLLEYLADASIHNRIGKLSPVLIRGALNGIATPEEMVLGGEILDGLTTATARTLVGGLQKDNPYQSLLAARYGVRSPFARFLPPPAVYQPPARSIQRYYFYDDDDAKLSFRAFRATYRGDKRWKWTESAQSIHLTATSRRTGRRIDIYANKPGFSSAALPLPARPNVLVHRGHIYHLDQTLRHLTDDIRLVFLGACRGTQSVSEVLHSASQAQMFATRGTGSHTVNDPMLKDLNERILAASGPVSWDSFWAAERKRFAKNPLFPDYVPPNRNTTAILLRAFYNYLLAD
jgi:hypothetical protein